MPRDFDDLRHGTIDVLVLKALSWEPMHGYAIANWIGTRASGDLMITDPALYKALHRLEAEGAIRGDWGLSFSTPSAPAVSISLAYPLERPAGRRRRTALSRRGACSGDAASARSREDGWGRVRHSVRGATRDAR